MKKLNDSAQLLLIAGFAIGVGIVVITVMLNNVIYASNMASESSVDTSRYDIANAIKTSTEAYQSAYMYSIQDNNNTTLYAEYISSFSSKASQNYATGGVTFSLQSHEHFDPYFTNSGLAHGKKNWTLVSSIGNTEEFVATIYTFFADNEHEPLVLEAVDLSGTSLWSVQIYNSSGSMNITVTDRSSTSKSMDTTPTNLEMNITGNRINGNEPFDFNFTDSTDGHVYSIKIYNGSNSIGMYTISGHLASGEPFDLKRYRIANPTLKMASSHMSINRTVPIPLPGGSV